MKNNLFYLDDQRVLYPAGHNVIIYNIDEKNQIYIPGIHYILTKSGRCGGIRRHFIDYR